MDEKVLVTGCNGFIALHVLSVLLSEGFHVIGTVRSQSKGNKVKESFAELYPYAKLDIEIVSDITQEGAFDAVLKKYPDLQHVLHMAANFSFGSDQGTNEETYLIPSTAGTKSILNSVLKLGSNVKTVVQTSSFASIMNVENPGLLHTEETWNPITWDKAKDNAASAYVASKKLAEKVSWEFLEEHASEVKFRYTAVCPPYVLGPQMFEWGLASDTLNTSAELVNSALKSTPKSEINTEEPNGLVCDVRDVALLHMLPLRNEKLGGQRLFPVSGANLKDHQYEDAKFNVQRILDVLNAKFPELNGKISKGTTKDNKGALAKIFNYNTDLTCELTGLDFKPFEVTVFDSAKQILDYQAAHK
ncbi:LAME_0H06458g1_1 [Lachancea meyersii CBS 8951]|uniref:LAME_0H06458g1_1 n=1 Tax=Lachancea meyersii CBS 8951 TaxID=1266667 RepID=A0A1G4KEJ0_9SACH|nr:LAME_0H06458g1_1 [Lachancea meyersii CBS 8951]